MPLFSQAASGEALRVATGGANNVMGLVTLATQPSVVTTSSATFCVPAGVNNFKGFCAPAVLPSANVHFHWPMVYEPVEPGPVNATVSFIQPVGCAKVKSAV